MNFDTYCLSYFNTVILSPVNGTVNHITLGAAFNYFGVIINGSARFCAQDADFTIGRGETVYIPKGKVYRSEWYGSPRPEFYSIPFVFMQDGKNDTRFSLQKVNIPNALQFAENIYKKCDDSPAEALSFFYSLYAAAQPLLEKEKNRSTTASVMPAIRYIEQHPEGKYDVPFLASLCRMSESGFYAVFKKHTSLTPIEYKNKVRCIRAAELLKSSDYTVEYISEKLGFASPMYMRRVLNKFTGKTPGQLRRELPDII